MAGPRPLMVFRERGDRHVLQQQPTGSAVAGFQSVLPNISEAEEELGRMTVGVSWDAARQQQQALALRRHQQQRMNSRPSLPHHLTTSVIHCGPGLGQSPDWDGGGGFARQIPIPASGRLQRSLLGDESVLRLRQQSVELLGELPRGISRQHIGEWRLREARDEITNSEFRNSAGRGWDEEARDGFETPSVYHRSSGRPQLEPSSRNRGVTYNWEETCHSDFVSRYGCLPRNLASGHAISAPAFQASNQFRKRSRNEEADCDRERLVRHRKLSGTGSPRAISALHSQAVLRRQGRISGSFRHLQAEEDEHEDGQLTPPSVMTSEKLQHVECRTQFFKQEQDITVRSRLEVGNKNDVDSRGYRDVFSFPALHGSPPSSPRPATARGDGLLSVEEGERLGSSRQSLKRDRLASARLKPIEHMMTRIERVTGGVESYSVLSSESADMRSSVFKESEVQTRAMDSKATVRRHDGLHYKKYQQNRDSPHRDVRSFHSSRKGRSGDESLDIVLLERLSKGSNSRLGSDKRRNGQAGEMTISVQKYGQRIVKVEEHRSKDTDLRASNQFSKDQKFAHRGGRSTQNASQAPFTGPADTDRLSVINRKSSNERQPASTLDKVSRSESVKVGVTYPQHQQISTSKEHVSSCPKHVKNEVITSADKHDIDLHRHNSIVSPLTTGFKQQTITIPETASASLRPEVLTFQQESDLLLPENNMLPVARCIDLSSSNSVQENSMVFQGFPVPTSDIEIVETGCLEKASSSQVGQPRDRLNQDILKVQSAYVLGREGLALQETKLETKSDPPLKPPEVLQNGSRLLDCAVLNKPDQLEPSTGGEALVSGLSLRSLHGNSDKVTAEVHDQLLGNGFKSFAKVISTGHKKEQFSKTTSPDSPMQESCQPLLPSTTDVVPVRKGSLQDLDRISTLSEECIQEMSGCMQDKPSINAKGKWFKSPPALTLHENASPQSILGDKNLCINRSAETSARLSLASFKDGQNEETISQASETESACQRNQDGVSPSMISELHVDIDGEATSGLSMALMVSSHLLLPKEVRLFGTNLNAPLSEQIDGAPKCGELVSEDVVTTAGLPFPGVGDAQSTACLDSTPVIEESNKDSCLSLQLTGCEDMELKEPVNAQEKPVIYDSVVDISTAVPPDAPSVKLQFELPASTSKEQYIPLTSLQKATTTVQEQQLVSSHSTGPHTWHRGTSSSTPVMSARIFRGSNAIGMTPSAGRARGVQGAAYVRKGNSLVRAPMPVSTLQPTNNVVMRGMSQAVRPMVRQLPAVKSTPFRNTFVANTVNGKSFYPTHRKYLAPPTISDSVITPPIRPPLDVPHYGIESDKSLPQPVASSKTPPQLALKVTSSAEAETANVEQQTGLYSSLELSPIDPCDDNAAQSDPVRLVNNSSTARHSTLELSIAGNPCSNPTRIPVLGNRLYVRKKANQLVVASSQSVDGSLTKAQNNRAGKTELIPGLYVKRKNNQLVRSNSGKGASGRKFEQGLLGKDPSPVITEVQEGGDTSVAKKMRLGRVLRQKKGPTGRSSWVWTLSGAAVGYAGAFPAHSLRKGPLLPWKRQHSWKTPLRPQRRRRLPEGKKGSLLFLMSKRLRRVRPVQPVYTRSADGFSLHRSGVMSLGGGNLKWTKSLEKRAKQASEAATKAVAEAERRKREKKEAVLEANIKGERRAARKASRGEGERIVWVGLVRYKMDAASKTLQRIPESKATGDTDSMTPGELAKTPSLLTPKRSIIGGTVYLRVGNGNQLVRDPKAISRALASEKVRWSLHNARSRGVKKQQFCQFFTKFGKCNKENGKCPYIHDPDKVAVCTKFLKGNCADDQCLLTHKVIPERMPDCSFFLEGLCTNENCPYRHVNVNPKAPYCDGFLRGYCKDGDKCNKKHRYICSVYAETGECLNRSCKFHHPKKKNKPLAAADGCKIGTKRKRRYFSSEEPNSMRTKGDALSFKEDAIPLEERAWGEGSMEFISLGSIESDDDQRVSAQSQPLSRLAGIFKMKEGLLDDVEKWIKPTFLLRVTSPTAAAQ